MAKNVLYMGLGEEATRGVAETTTVGFLPLLSPAIPKLEFDEKKRSEFRGEETVTGFRAVQRMSQKWSDTLEMPFFTEAGASPGMAGTLLKHFFGTVTSGENGVTGQYHHMMYPVADPFDPTNLGTKALTLNLNINEGGTVRNWPFVGGRVSSLTFLQEAGQHLKVSATLFGQKRDVVGAAIGSAVFPAENLRCDYNNLSLYTGTIDRTGTGPDYTDFSFASATRIRPDRISVKIENGMEDVLRLSGLDYPDRTRLGRYRVTLELTIDWEDPSSGFSSVDEVNAWINTGGTTNFLLHWDTGTQAGSGDNHGLYIDIPLARRTGGEPNYDLEKDPMVTLSYEGLYDETTTKYVVGCLLKNTAPSV